ncbi:hypothetical protein [Phyllobacterium chamaecytisi]|nr:hypothetical protein [Phyllobacterium sp. KW56]
MGNNDFLIESFNNGVLSQEQSASGNNLKSTAALQVAIIPAFL